MSDNKETANIRIKNALCYIPLAAIFIHFTETKKTKELEKHIKYWIIMFVWYAILNVVLWMFLWGILFLVYLWFSWFFWFKAYNWEDFNISFIDNYYDNKNKEDKKDKKESSDKDDDVLNF